MTDTPTKTIIIKLLDEISDTTQPSLDLSLAIIDLVVTTCYFAMDKWSRLEPQDPNIGILLLTLQLQCLETIKVVKPADQPASTQEGSVK